MGTGDDFTLERDAMGHLVLVDAAGKRHVGVAPVRSFPITAAQYGLAIVDAHGHELHFFDDATAVPDHLRELLEEELRQRDFVPVIRRVLRVSSDTEPSQWDVETDRGPTCFQLDDEDDVRRLGPYRAVIVDAHSVRYLVDDVRQLDAASRRILDNYL